MTALAFPLIKGLLRHQPRQVVSSSWSDRTSVLEKDVNLFCWTRSINRDIQDYLTNRIEYGATPLKFDCNIEEISEQFQAAKYQWDHDLDVPGALEFWEDVRSLTRDFLGTASKNQGSVHIQVVANDACTKFHIDGYRLRLFTTYIGEGTEWLSEKATNRGGLGVSNERIVKDKTLVKRMETFEVGILKGEVSNAPSQTRGIVHRSPQISASGQKRVILRVDI